MAYNPSPIDISGVELTPELAPLGEQLAESAHDRWSQARLAQGWTYGPTRDDAKKHHPCLVPYEELTESDKDLDRVTALGTLRTVLALGYRILPPR